jgi:hypothetical protein
MPTGKAAADKKISPLTDLVFKADRTCGLVFHDGMVWPDAKYQVTVIGKITRVSIEQGSFGWGGRIASVTETELVLEYGLKDNTWVKVRYTRVK